MIDYIVLLSARGQNIPEPGQLCSYVHVFAAMSVAPSQVAWDRFQGPFLFPKLFYYFQNLLNYG